MHKYIIACCIFSYCIETNSVLRTIDLSFCQDWTKNTIDLLILHAQKFQKNTYNNLELWSHWNQCSYLNVYIWSTENFEPFQRKDDLKEVSYGTTCIMQLIPTIPTIVFSGMDWWLSECLASSQCPHQSQRGEMRWDLCGVSNSLITVCPYYL